MQRLAKISQIGWAPIVCSVAALALLGGCGSEEFSVGDCVTTEQRLTDSELKSADCPAGGSFDPGKPVYKVDEAMDGTDGTCTPQGFGGVQFKDEPADKVYCLSFAR